MKACLGFSDRQIWYHLRRHMCNAQLLYFYELNTENSEDIPTYWRKATFA